MITWTTDAAAPSVLRYGTIKGNYSSLSMGDSARYTVGTPHICLLALLPASVSFSDVLVGSEGPTPPPSFTAASSRGCRLPLATIMLWVTAAQKLSGSFLSQRILRLERHRILPLPFLVRQPPETHRDMEKHSRHLHAGCRS